MIRTSFIALALLFAAPVFAQEAADEAPTEGEDADEAVPAEPGEAPYDGALNRLAELAGALYHLEAICEPGSEERWRRNVADLVEAQRLDEARRGRVFASFNTGYRGIAALHRRCTPASRALIGLHAEEGARLATDLASRYGD